MKKVDALGKNTCLRMEVIAVRSQFQQQSGAVSILSAPLSPWIHAESIYSPIPKWHTVRALTWIMGEDQHTMLS